jgi:2-polyprenyl-3-methyl-5-hydroxy-6-metoxy-1,4-benzoquinol methylase
MGVTRGYGLLEPFLAHQRARQANKLIKPSIRQGRILDIGCGSDPYFLAHTLFKEKFAIEQLPVSDPKQDISWFTLDLNDNPNLPFEDGFFNVVTMLAVVEHLNPKMMVDLFMECRRVLTPNGMVVLTTPSAWSNRLLRIMARLRLVSKEEIDDHVYGYTLPLIGWYFGAAGFEMEKVNFGYFEFGFNMWAVAHS